MNQTTSENDTNLILAAVKDSLVFNGMDAEDVDEEELALALEPLVSDFCDQEAQLEMTPAMSMSEKEQIYQSFDFQSASISNDGPIAQAEYIITALQQQNRITLPLSPNSAKEALAATGWFSFPGLDTLE